MVDAVPRGSRGGRPSKAPTPSAIPQHHLHALGDLVQHRGTRGEIRNCANDRCTRLYVDTSRAGNRRWCGMAECGNAVRA
ncbi:CGNR zinc finger domain-containing protein [Kineosporia mesophila]|uniref:CGNR zinc finger domain-containing protein n=1 Tax=Kineosporia mesophila TaxID=566012 RepID=UPI0031EB4C59